MKSCKPVLHLSTFSDSNTFLTVDPDVFTRHSLLTTLDLSGPNDLK